MFNFTQSSFKNESPGSYGHTVRRMQPPTIEGLTSKLEQHSLLALAVAIGAEP